MLIHRRIAALLALLTLAPIGLVGTAHADPNGQMYGDPGAAAPYWRYQHQEDCGLMAVADVVGQVTGHEPLQIGIELRGLFTPSTDRQGSIYAFDGTSPQDMVALLEHYGVASELSTGNTLTGLEQDLAAGHKVIAGLNAETIWNYPAGQGQRTDADRSRRACTKVHRDLGECRTFVHARRGCGGQPT